VLYCCFVEGLIGESWQKVFVELYRDGTFVWYKKKNDRNSKGSVSLKVRSVLQPFFANNVSFEQLILKLSFIYYCVLFLQYCIITILCTSTMIVRWLEGP